MFSDSYINAISQKPENVWPQNKIHFLLKIYCTSNVTITVASSGIFPLLHCPGIAPSSETVLINVNVSFNVFLAR